MLERQVGGECILDTERRNEMSVARPDASKKARQAGLNLVCLPSFQQASRAFQKLFGVEQASETRHVDLNLSSFEVRKRASKQCNPNSQAIAPNIKTSRATVLICLLRQQASEQENSDQLVSFKRRTSRTNKKASEKSQARKRQRFKLSLSVILERRVSLAFFQKCLFLLASEKAASGKKDTFRRIKSAEARLLG